MSCVLSLHIFFFFLKDLFVRENHPSAGFGWAKSPEPRTQFRSTIGWQRLGTWVTTTTASLGLRLKKLRSGGGARRQAQGGGAFGLAISLACSRQNWEVNSIFTTITKATLHPLSLFGQEGLLYYKIIAIKLYKNPVRPDISNIGTLEHCHLFFHFNLCFQPGVSLFTFSTLIWSFTFF